MVPRKTLVSTVMSTPAQQDAVKHMYVVLAVVNG